MPYILSCAFYAEIVPALVSEVTLSWDLYAHKLLLLMQTQRLEMVRLDQQESDSDLGHTFAGCCASIVDTTCCHPCMLKCPACHVHCFDSMEELVTGCANLVSARALIATKSFLYILAIM